MALQDVSLNNPEANEGPINEGVVAQPAEGDIEQAKAQVGVVIKSLEPLIAVFGGESEEGSAIRKTLDALYKGFPNQGAGDLVPSETANMLQSLPMEDQAAIAPEILAAAEGPGPDVNADLGQAGADAIPPDLINQLGG